MEDRRTTLGNEFVGSSLDGGGCMNYNHFVGLEIRFEVGGWMNSARQSIYGAPDSMVEDA